MAGNLAVYALRVGRPVDAHRMALYALGLRCRNPERLTFQRYEMCPDRTGRTADWETLAAALSALGRAEQAKQAVMVARATVIDDERRQRSAYCGSRYTQGSALIAPNSAVYGDLWVKYAGRDQEVCKPLWEMLGKTCR
jgi:hypothetical protein